MKRTVGVIHATFKSIQPVMDAFANHAPGTQVLNFLDEGLLHELNRAGQMTSELEHRFSDIIHRAASPGVNGILTSCSAFCILVSAISRNLHIPLLNVDGPMIEEAVERGKRIGVIVTVPAAGKSAQEQLQSCAKQRGKNIDVEIAIAEGAFAALDHGDFSRHDEMIHQTALQISKNMDVLVLAQISMARAAATMADLELPVLTSPKSCVEAIMKLISTNEGTQRS